MSSPPRKRRSIALAAGLLWAGTALGTAPGARCDERAGAASGAATAGSAAAGLVLPRRQGSVRFAVVGDSGTGQRPQFEVGRKMAELRADYPFEFVLMCGDNIYGGESPRDYALRFEQPYAALLRAGVRFYAALGNHDGPNQRFYKPFNMNGERYYSFARGPVRFFALDTNRLDRAQLDWLERALGETPEPWKICFFHHPLYSSARRHGPDLRLRAALEPLLVRHGVRVVFAGHDHVYERLVPQRGVQHFVSGAAGQLRHDDLAPSPQTARGFARDRHFMLVEVDGDTLHFQTVAPDAPKTL